MDEGEILSRLAARYSPSGAEQAAVSEFVRVARTLGYRARVDRVGNGIAERGSGRPRVMFLGHIDTVEGRRPVRRTRRSVAGRGVVDAKGALASALLAGGEFSGPGTWSVVAAVGEETDSRGARALVRGPRPDRLIAGEPSGWDGVTIGYKGDLRLEVEFRQPRTHWGSPHPTASDQALAWVGSLREALRPSIDTTAFRSVTIKVVGFASDPGADPEVARLHLDVRIPPGTTTAAVLAHLPAEPTPRSVHVRTRIEPTEVGRADPVVAALCAAIRAAGGRPTLWRKTGTSDLNLASRAWGIGGAAYGPGDARLDHTAREVVSLAELRRATRVLREALGRLTEEAGGPTAPAVVPAP